MLIRFSSIAFLERDERLSVVGSVPELGCWNVASAVPLVPVKPPETKLRPTFWTCVIETAATANFRYKFVKWNKERDEILPHDSVSVTVENQLSFPVPSLRLRQEYSAFPPLPDVVQWEGFGNEDDRMFNVSDPVDTNRVEYVQRAELTHPDAQTHYYDPQMNLVEEISEVWVAKLPPVRDVGVQQQVQWVVANPSGKPCQVYALQSTPFAHHLSEYSQTTQYYHSVRDANEIDYDKVLDRVYVGTCPRRPEHFSQLKKELGITVMMNFQAEEDARHNWPDPDGFPNLESRTPSALYDMVARNGIDYVWLPTTDMDTGARAQIAAQASWILAGLLANEATTGVYVHCNAGVGRSSSCVAGYLINCLGQSLRKANLLLCMRRNMAYFDAVAQAVGAVDYRRKFGSQSVRSLLPFMPRHDSRPNDELPPPQPAAAAAAVSKIGGRLNT